MWKNLEQQESDYNTYHFSLMEGVLACLYTAAVILVFALFFYRSGWAVLALSPLSVPIWKSVKRKKLAQRKQDLRLQFKDCMRSVTTNLKAGYSAENAFRESLPDMRLLYGEDSIMVVELERMVRCLANHIPLEELLLSLGRRSGVEEIREFAEVFSIAKRNGGNMSEILTNAVTVIRRKLETDREIQVLISAKKLEQKIMSQVPFGIILYICVTSPGFFDPLYHTLPGVIVMTVCLGIYFAAYRLSSSIVAISVE